MQLSNPEISGEQSVKIVLLGDSGVGKSSLALRFVTNEFRPYSESTIGASFMSKSITVPFSPSVRNDEGQGTSDSKTLESRQHQRTIGLKIWDTAGQEKYRSLAPMYYRGAEAAILVYDITVPASFVALQDWALELQHNASPELMLVICGNKSDLGECRRVDRGVGEAYAREMGAVYVETSAKDGQGVEDMFSGVAMRIPPLLGQESYLEEDMLDLRKNTRKNEGCC
ncbi:hypothetical protein HJC23_009976 [Cyclotella cryptica]|uniref:Uncharacterized protein n=1 Tax=Cyclotella cryptica TaxID=29204 RepID=A0ABD3Q9P3_9STRA|eukprot:CCRYP_007749-RA/>CCRYP_007749-RA protein AED:0.02 eAED:0.02 QI:0/-1/0/1/-1/1/1/0/226